MNRALKRKMRATESLPSASLKKVAWKDDDFHQDETVTALEDKVFGDEGGLEDNIAQPDEARTKKSKTDSDDDDESDDESTRPAPAWNDEEDEETILESSVKGGAKWARLAAEKKSDSGNESDEEHDIDIRRTVRDFLGTSAALPRKVIQLKKCTDANKEHPTGGKVKSVEFHPTAQVLLTAGMDQYLNLFQVDGRTNPKIQSLLMDKNYPIFSAHFTRDGQQVVMSSKHCGFKYFDMISGAVTVVPKVKSMNENNMKRMIMSPDGKFIVFLGNFGAIHFFSAKSKEWINTLKMNGSVEAAAFNSDASKLYSIGDKGKVAIWDVNHRSIINQFADEGCFTGTALAASPNDRYIAVGSNQGIVNMYDQSHLEIATPTPVKVLKNLGNICTDMKFNPTSEILAFSSNNAENAAKLVHMPTLSVFKNFPDREESLRIPFCMDFSRNGGYFSIGNHRGQALLYRVKHYATY